MIRENRFEDMDLFVESDTDGVGSIMMRLTLRINMRLIGEQEVFSSGELVTMCIKFG